MFVMRSPLSLAYGYITYDTKQLHTLENIMYFLLDLV